MKRIKTFENINQSILYLVATPIGNLQEFTPRAIEIINKVDLIACEDTRNTFSLLAKFNIKKNLFSLHEHNENEASETIIGQLKQGKSIAYVSDAGYPCISDPGYLLVKKVIASGYPVCPISGSNALINGLICSGIDTSHFYFHGFLPPKENEAKEELKTILNKKETIIFYESPHRISKTLTILYNLLGDRNACIARELTKINEEFIYGTLQELKEIDTSTLKGEMVIIIEGNKNQNIVDEKTIKDRLDYLLTLNIDFKTACIIVSEELGINKNLIKGIYYKK